MRTTTWATCMPSTCGNPRAASSGTGVRCRSSRIRILIRPNSATSAQPSGSTWHRRWPDTGERASALAVLQEAIDHDPENYRSYFNRAGLALEAGDESSAKRDFAAAAERMQADPGSLDDDPERLEYLGYALFHLGRNEEAVVKLERLLQQHPDNHSARRNLGYILLELDRPADAQRQFEQAFPAEPDEIDGWLGLLVCVALTEYPGRLADLKSQFDKRFATRHALDDGLPQRLQGQGYWYSPRFKQLWTTAMASR